MFVGWEQTLAFLGVAAVQLLLAGLVLVRPPQRQSSALAWILLILLLPGFGAACFLLFGDVRTGHPRRRRHREIVTRVRAAAAAHPCPARAAELPDVDFFKVDADLGTSTSGLDPAFATLVTGGALAEDVKGVVMRAQFDF